MQNPCLGTLNRYFSDMVQNIANVGCILIIWHYLKLDQTMFCIKRWLTWVPVASKMHDPHKNRLSQTVYAKIQVGIKSKIAAVRLKYITQFTIRHDLIAQLEWFSYNWNQKKYRSHDNSRKSCHRLFVIYVTQQTICHT